MNTLVIFSTLFVVILVIYLIGYKKEIVLLQRMSLPFLLPCSAGVLIPFLLSRLPDSYHLFLFSTIAISLSSLMLLVDVFPFKRNQFVENLLFILSNLTWIVIFYPIFYIKKVSVLFIAIFVVFYLFLIVFFCVKFVIKSISQLIHLFFLLAIAFILNFISIVTIAYFHKPYSFVFLAGTLLMFAFSFASASTRFKTGIKNSKLIMNLLFIFSELCVYASSVLMLF